VFAFKMAGVYLMSIGSVEELRQSMGLPAELPGDSLVLKWGRTDDMNRRLEEHHKQYGSLQGASLNLVHFAPIDPRLQSSAEADAKVSICKIGKHLKCVKLRGQFKTELVLMTMNDLQKAAKPLFQRIAWQYAGCLKDMQHELTVSTMVGEQQNMRLQDKDSIISELRQDKKQLLQDKQDQQQELRECKQELRECKQELRECKQNEQQLQQEVCMLKQQIRQLQGTT
jgi:myosin heavy subunit